MKYWLNIYLKMKFLNIKTGWLGSQALLCMLISRQRMKEIAVSRAAAVVNLKFLILKNKAMKKQMKDPCCGNGNGCCTGAMVD